MMKFLLNSPLLGLVLLLIYMYWRFIRERSPAPIFHEDGLSLRSIIVLSALIIIYVSISTSLLFSIHPSGSLTKIIDVLYVPLRKLDRFFKQNRLIGLQYNIISVKFLHKSTRIHAIWNHRRKNKKLSFYAILLIFFQILPRTILLVAFGYDVLLAETFSVLYKVLPIALILLMDKYLIFSLKEVKEYFAEETRKCIQVILLNGYINEGNNGKDDDYVPGFNDVNEAIEVQINGIVYNHVLYTPRIFLRQDLIKMINEQHLDRKSFTTLVQNYFKTSVTAGVHLEEYNKFSNSPFIKNLKIIIFLSYASIWIYILFRNQGIFDCCDPFSGMLLEEMSDIIFTAPQPDLVQYKI